MFKVLILQVSHSLSDERTEFLIKDRLSFMRVIGLELSDPVSDANTIWTFREALTRAEIGGRPAVAVLFSAYEAALREAGFLAMGGQIADAAVVAAAKQRNTEAEKADLKVGRVPDTWRAQPVRLAQKERDARRTIKSSKAEPAEDGAKRVDIAVQAFGYKTPCWHRSQPWADPHLDGHRRGPPRWGTTAWSLSKANTASDVWADTTYRSKANVWTRGLLVRRSLSDGSLAYFATWCTAGTPVEKLVIVESRRSRDRGRVRNLQDGT